MIVATESGEPIFILRAQDETAPAMITAWLAMNPHIGEEKRNAALATRRAMLDWPKRKKAD